MIQMLIFVHLLVRNYQFSLKHQSKIIYINPLISHKIHVFCFRSHKVVNLILPLLVILSTDENLIVRQTCFESLLDLHKQLIDSESIEEVSEMIISLVKFGLSSKTSKFISTIALRLGDLCHALTGKDKFKYLYSIFIFFSTFFKFFILMNMNLFMNYFYVYVKKK